MPKPSMEMPTRAECPVLATSVDTSVLPAALGAYSQATSPWKWYGAAWPPQESPKLLEVARLLDE